MPTHECQLCDRDGVELRTLVHDETESQIQVCPRCIRDNTRAKASRSDQRAREFMQKNARESQLELWRREHVLYLLDPLQPAPQREEALLAGGAPRARRSEPSPDR